MTELTIEYLKECFELIEPEGKIIWKVRPRSHFNCDRGCKIVNSKNAGKEAFTVISHQQYITEINGKRYYKKRILTSLRLGRILKKEEVPVSKNGIQYDYRAENLFIGSLSDARRAALKPNKSGYIGVTKQCNKFSARIYSGGKNTYIGSFNTPEEAARAYDEKAKELFGDKVVLNVGSDVGYKGPPDNYFQE